MYSVLFRANRSVGVEGTSSSQQGVAHARSKARCASGVLLLSLVAGCATAYSPAPLPSDHPANAQAAEAPPPLASRALETTDVAQPKRSPASGKASEGKPEGMEGMKGMPGMEGMQGMHSMRGGHQ
jgi:hypothetical protein